MTPPSRKKARPVRKPRKTVDIDLNLGGVFSPRQIRILDPDTRRGYLWIGPPEGIGGPCYGHLTNKRTLRKLRDALTELLENRPGGRADQERRGR